MHGLVGVVRGANLITSPNADSVPDLQLQRCAVGLCTDMRFGRDDYILAPQWYHDDYPHLAAIPKRPKHGDPSPYSSMWHSPTRDLDFTLVDSYAADRRPGYVHKRLEADLSKLTTDLCAEAHRVLDGLPAEPSPVAAALTCVRHAWLILTSTAASFEEKRLEFVEFQRAWLELRAMLDYRAWNESSARNLLQVPPAEPKRCIGCFTDSLHVAITLFDLGIPVWLVRDKMAVLQSDVYIQRATSRTVAPEDDDPPICVERDDSFPLIYVQSPRDKLHYLAQHKFSRIRSVVYAVSGAGKAVLPNIQREEMRRQDAATVVVELQTMRAQAAAAAAGPSNAPSTAVSSSSSSSSTAAAEPPHRQRHAPCEFLSIFILGLII